MSRELKLVVSIFTAFFIYGLVSLFSVGAFVTPYFLTPIILFLVSGFFLIINIKEKHSFLLFLNVLYFFIAVLLDDFSINYLATKFSGINAGLPFLNTPPFLIVTFVVSYSILITDIGYVKKQLNTIYPVIFLTSLIVLSIVFIVLKNSTYFEISIGLFYLSFTIFCNRLISNDNKSVHALASQFLLALLLQGFQYLV